MWTLTGADTQFQPTPSARRVTQGNAGKTAADRISTHTLRKEGDAKVARYFNEQMKFQPTPSARRVTEI